MAIYITTNIEEDRRLYRKFIKSQLFRNASRALAHLETEQNGLTPAEVWQEVEQLLSELRTIDRHDRDVAVVELMQTERTRLERIERNEDVVKRNKDEVDRSLTCVFYCLALLLEAAAVDQMANPHNELLDAVVEELIAINHPVLRTLHRQIDFEGDRNEIIKHQYVPQQDPLMESDQWTDHLHELMQYYYNRMSARVKREKLPQFDMVWEALEADGMFAELMSRPSNVKGDFAYELGFQYNAKLMFNVFGLLYGRHFFSGINGWKPLAEAVSEHYDRNGNKVVARNEDFKIEMANNLQQHNAMTADMQEHIISIIEQHK